MNQDIQNKIKEAVRDYLFQTNKYYRVEEVEALIRKHSFIAGTKFILSSPELMKEAMEDFYKSMCLSPIMGEGLYNPSKDIVTMPVLMGDKFEELFKEYLNKTPKL